MSDQTTVLNIPDANTRPALMGVGKLDKRGNGVSIGYGQNSSKITDTRDEFNDSNDEMEDDDRVLLIPKEKPSSGRKDNLKHRVFVGTSSVFYVLQTGVLLALIVLGGVGLWLSQNQAERAIHGLVLGSTVTGLIIWLLSYFPRHELRSYLRFFFSCKYHNLAMLNGAISSLLLASLCLYITLFITTRPQMTVYLFEYLIWGVYILLIGGIVSLGYRSRKTFNYKETQKQQIQRSQHCLVGSITFFVLFILFAFFHLAYCFSDNGQLRTLVMYFL
ncbi:hypothetical protein NEHOM01_2016 [Nematocida homosporus]|uniref:uncharacterized protein n=1 Tax=Nematocida homosporus TaxID=1912981 RepID=UPI00221F806E|nr:uncharacterized protein NEHOM01_2016 [Nematocida homosporus]KAI5187218.1 hypothetical protein NEHOM01_2016 [Nematocida homosporus]